MNLAEVEVNGDERVVKSSTSIKSSQIITGAALLEFNQRYNQNSLLADKPTAY